MKQLLNLALAALVSAGANAGLAGEPGGNQAPTFTLAWSEYPSWSVFGVAQDEGLLARMEQKWNVSVKLSLLDYEKCIAGYSAKTVDAACLTNMDALAPALGRKSVAVLPTSTSVGADALLAVGVERVEELKAKKIAVYGLPESVSQYTFARILEKKGLKDSDFEWKAMDPDKAAAAMQAKSKDVSAIMVWNPFVLQTEKLRKDAKRLFDSSDIPEEIIDMVVVAQDVLDKPGGDRFACCLIDTFYEFNKMLADPANRDDLLVKLGGKFFKLSKEEMAVACVHTRFYRTPDAALRLMTGDKLPKTMDMIVKFWVDRKWLKDGAPKLGYGTLGKANEAQFRIDPTYINKVKDQK